MECRRERRSTLPSTLPQTSETTRGLSAGSAGDSARLQTTITESGAMMRSKYGNRKVTIDGQTFDSKREYNRYRELLLMVRARAIHDLVRQVKF